MIDSASVLKMELTRFLMYQMCAKNERRQGGLQVFVCLFCLSNGKHGAAIY